MIDDAAQHTFRPVGPFVAKDRSHSSQPPASQLMAGVALAIGLAVGGAIIGLVLGFAAYATLLNAADDEAYAFVGFAIFGAFLGAVTGLVTGVIVGFKARVMSGKGLLYLALTIVGLIVLL